MPSTQLGFVDVVVVGVVIVVLVDVDVAGEFTGNRVVCGPLGVLLAVDAVIAIVVVAVVVTAFKQLLHDLAQ